MTIGLASNVPYFHARICFLVFILCFISASDGSKYNQNIQMTHKQPKESLVERKRSRAGIHHENKAAHSGNRNAQNSVSASENNNSPALRNFLENVLKAQNELKWIDQAVHKMKLQRQNSENSTELENTYSSRSAAATVARMEETRDKRGFNTNRNSEISPEHRKRKYESDDSLGVPERIYSDEEMMFRRPADNSDFKYDKTNSSGSIDKPINEELEVSKNLFSNRDNCKSSQENFKDTVGRCSSDYETLDKDLENAGTISSEKSQTMKEANVDELPLSFETLKQTVLELSKSLIESNKGTNGNIDVTNISRLEEYERQVGEGTAKKEGQTKNEHEREMSSRDSKNSNTAYGDYTGKIDKNVSNWYEDPGSAAEAFDFKKRENLEDANYSEDINDSENNYLKDDDNSEEHGREIPQLKKVIQRVKREEEDNEEENFKLFHRAGFGELSPEILNDRRKRSKKSLEYEEKPDAIQASSQSLIRQTTGNNSEFSVESPDKLLIEKSILPNKTFHSSSVSQNQKEKELRNLIQNKNEENQTLGVETKSRNKNQTQPDFNETLLISDLRTLNESSNTSDYNIPKGKSMDRNISENNLQGFNIIPVEEGNYINEKENLLNLKMHELPELNNDNYTIVNNIVIDPGLYFLLGGEETQRRRKLLWIKEKLRKGRRMLQKVDSDDKRHFYEKQSKFQKRANKIDRFRKLLKRSPKKEEDEDADDIGDYEDEDREDIQNYNDREEDSEDRYVRKRHVPVLYFDYEEAANEDEESPIMAKIQFKRKDTPGGKYVSHFHKKNKQKDEEEKLDRDKERGKYKIPKEEFVGNINIPEIGKNESSNETLNERPNPKDFPFRGEMKRGKEDENDDEESMNDHRSDMDPHLWSDQSETQKLLRALNKDNEDPGKIIFSEPLEYNLNFRGKLKAGAISDFLSNDLPLEERLFAQDKDLLSFENNEEDYEPQRNAEYRRLEENDVIQENDLRPTYEDLEIEKDWRGGGKERFRLRDGHRIYLDSDEDSDSGENRFNKYRDGTHQNWHERESESQSELNAESRSSQSDKDDQISEEENNLSDAQDNIFENKPKGQSLDSHNIDDRKASSGSSYLALKMTDDMFKGGIEQSNSTEEKPSKDLDASQRTTEWINFLNEETNAKSAEDSLKQPVMEADFIFQREDIDSPEDIAYKKKHPSRDKRSILNSDDLMHESFVESLDWMNDFGDDDDKKIRLGRGLKSFQGNNTIENRTTGNPYSEQQEEQKSTLIYLNNITDKFDDVIRNLTTDFTRDKNKENNKADTFPVHEEKPDIEEILRIRREANFGKNYLDNSKSKYRIGDFRHKHRRAFNKRVRDDLINSKMKKNLKNYHAINHFNHLSPLRRQANSLYRGRLRNRKNRNRRHKINHRSNFKSRNENDRVPMKKYSPQDKHFHHHRKNESPDGLKKKKFEDFLKVENVEDDSQMNLAVHGQLAAMIVEKIFEEVEKNEALKTEFGPKLFQKEKPETTELHKPDLHNPDHDEKKRTEEVIRKIMKILENIIHEEVRRKTCMSLTPEMQEFLDWMLQDETEKETSSQQCPRPHTLNRTEHTQNPEKFLFHSEANNLDLEELYKIVRLLKSMIEEYNALAEKEKAAVQSVHDYLVRQLSNLVKYIEFKEAEAKNQRKSSYNEAHNKLHGTNYLRLQAKHHEENKSYKNMPLIMKLQSKDAMMHRIKKRNTRSVHRKPHRRKKHKKQRRKHRKRKKHKYKPGRTSREYRKMEHRKLQFRRKRTNIDDADWDSHDSGYEKRGPDISQAESYGYSFGNDERGSSNVIDLAKDYISEKSTDVEKKRSDSFLPIKGKNKAEDEMILLNKREAWKRKNEQQLEEVSFGEDMRSHMKKKERFEKLVRKENANEESPERKKREKIFSGQEIAKKKRCCSIRSSKQNKATDERNGFLAMKIKVIEILPMSLDDSDCKCDEKNEVVEDEVRKIEEKTNVYPETTELIETKCFRNSENITTSYGESNQKLQVDYINEKGYHDFEESETTIKNERKIVNFDLIDKQLKNRELKDSEDRKLTQDSEKETHVKNDQDKLISKLNALVLNKSDKSKKFRKSI